MDPSIVSPMYPSATSDTYSQWYNYCSSSLGSFLSPNPYQPYDPSFWSVSYSTSSVFQPGSGSFWSSTPSTSTPPALPPMCLDFPGSQNFWSWTPSASPPVQSTPIIRPPDKAMICTNCQVTETVKWRNIRTNVLCNACFVYKRKYKKCRPTEAIRKMQVRKTATNQ